MKRILGLVAIILLLSACETEIPRNSPFDLLSALEKQAPESVTGAVVLEGETDFGQITVELQNEQHTYTASSRADGTFLITGVKPGLYDVRYTTRYYEEREDEITVRLGKTADLGLHELALRRAAVVGKASALRNAGEVGGLLVTLSRTAGIRGAQASSAPKMRPAWGWLAETPDDDVTLTVVSGADGNFRLSEVPAGVYAVTIDGSGAGAVGEVTVTGELAVVELDPVTLDQRAPAVPDLANADIDGDGFALGASYVELTWTRPSDTDLAGFELQRYVKGIDTAFRTVASLSAGKSTYLDSLTDTVGRKHMYRIRSVDLLGNLSDWSLTVEAEPFESIQHVYWTRSDYGYHYFFPVQPGTNSLSAVYFHHSAAKSRYSTALANNVPEWLRPTAWTDHWEESLMLRTSNQTNSLAYESAFSLGINHRSIVKNDSSGAYFGYGCAIATDAAGEAHVVHSDGYFNGMYIATKQDGKWVSTIFDSTAGTVNHAEVFMTGAAHHAVYNVAGVLRYATDVSGDWQIDPIRTFTDFRGMDGVIDSAGRIHIAATLNNAGSMSLLYLRIVDGVIDIDEIIEATGSAQEPPGIAVGSDGKVHIVYYQSASADFKYATRTGPATWSLTTLDSAGSVGSYPSLAIDIGGALHAAYILNSDGVSATNELRYVNKPNAQAWSTPATIYNALDVRRFTAIAVTPEGERMVFFSAGAETYLYAARNSGLGWSVEQVDTTIENYRGQSMRAVVDARHRVNLVYMHLDERDVRHLMFSGSTRPEERVDNGWAYYIDMAAANTAETHLVFGKSSNLAHYTNRTGKWTSSIVETGVNFGKIAAADDTVHVAYQKAGIQYAYDAGSGWTKENVSADGDYYALALGANADPAIAWTTSGTPSTLKFRSRNSTWAAAQTIATAASSLTYGLPVLAFSGDAPVVAARLGVYSWHTAHLFKRSDAGEWIRLAFAPPVTMGTISSIATDEAGAIHVAYLDDVDYDLWYATNKGGAWSYRLLDHEGDTGFSARIRIDDFGHVHIYYLGSGSDLYYATNVGGWRTLRVVDEPYGITSFAVATDDEGTSHGVAVRGSWVDVMPFLGGRLPAASVERVAGW